MTIFSRIAALTFEGKRWVRRMWPGSFADRAPRRPKEIFAISSDALDDGPRDILLTVIVPTLNRAGTLASTIRTCLSQDDPNLRVVVSDNASTDDTEEVVASFSDYRLKYVNPRRRLGMAEHWEFALAHVQPGFVTVLGDDDGLLPNAVRAARQLIAKYRTKVLTWQKVEYHWPDHIVPSFRNWLQIPVSSDVVVANAKDVVRDVLAFRKGYSSLPCIYNSFISTDVINSFRRRNDGVFFGASNPDIFSAFAVASEVDEFVFCERPLSVNGASSKSNGTMQTLGAKDDRLAASFWSDTKYTFEPGLPNVAVVEFCVVDSFLKVRKSSPGLPRDLIDNEMLLRSAVGSTFSGYIPIERRDDRLGALKSYAESCGLLDLFEQLCALERGGPKRGGLPSPGYHPGSYLVFDALMFGATDVYAVSIRTAEVLDLAEKQKELFDRLLQTTRPEIAVALFARAKGGDLRLHLGCGGTHFDGYVNVDFPQSEHNVMTVRADVFCDLTQIDLPEEVVEEVRLQHVFEHLNRAVALASVIRWQQWLRLGGRLHIETPDFEASAAAFLQADDLATKMRAIRHLEGDQADGWAYHIGQWFPARFQRTFECLGLADIEIRREHSAHSPPLHNVVAIGQKTGSRSQDEQVTAACDLLKDLMVAEEEQPTWEVWRSQLLSILCDGARPTPAIRHPGESAQELVA